MTSAKRRQTPDGWVTAFSFTLYADETRLPFVRGGSANDGGRLLQTSLGAGMIVGVLCSVWQLRRFVTTLFVTLVIVVEATVLLSGAPPAQDNQTPDEHAATQVDIRDLLARWFGGDQDGEPDETLPRDEDSGETRLLVFPTVGGNPAVGLAIGALVSLTNYWGDPSTTPLSSTVASTSFTTKQQVQVVARSDLYAPNDTWHLRGDWRYYRFNERTHGLGSDRADRPAADVNYDWYRLHQTVYRPFRFGLEAGVGYHLDVHTRIRLAEDQPIPTLPPGEATELASTISSGLSVNVVFDNRDHPLKPERGLFGRASYTFYRTGLGSDTDWDSLQLEGRVYQRLPGTRRQTVAFWGMGWLTRAGDPPYFDLPSVGWDTYGRTARGYRAGRFRGRSWIYTELEYRTDVTRNGLLGAVGFVNASTLSDFETRDFQQVGLVAGVGVRIKLDKERRSNVAIDLAWEREGSRGVFLALNEAF